MLHEKTEGVEIVDDHTVRFHFKEPFLDFPILLGTGNVCGAGWVVPAKYYEKVGQAGFLQKPIGAGPYKLVSQQPGVKLEFEAFDGLLPPGPHQAVHDGQRAGGGDARRDARTRRGGHHVFRPGRIDRPGQEQSEADGWRRWSPATGGSSSPASRTRRTRSTTSACAQAISLAVDRDAINDAECGGMGVVDGNWINDDVEYGWNGRNGSTTSPRPRS